MNITSWDTHGDEQKYLGGLYDALLLKKNLALTEKLLLGLDETWFTDPYHRQLFLAAFRNATLAYDPDSRVTITGVLDDAERELGETGWARDVFQRCSEAAGIFEPQRFLDEEAPLWWEKQKRQKIQQSLAKADQLLAVPPRQETMSDVRDYLTAAIGTVDQEPLCGQEAENAVMRAWNEFLEPLPPETTISTGMKCMDGVLGGGLSGPGAPAGGKLIIVTARPGVGKTQLAINMALRVALRGYKVAMWSLEMQATQIAARLFAAMDYLNVSPGPWHGGVMTFRQITTRNMPPAVRERYEASKPQAQAVADAFRVFSASDVTAQQIANTMRVFSRANPDCRLFVIDHLGLLNVGTNPNRASAIGDATRLLKTTANELGIDVLLLCQVNRGLESREDKMPELADLRDSGRIEEDADVVVGLMRPVIYNPQADPHDLRIGILKNRQGALGTFRVGINLDGCAIYEAFDSPI